MNRLLLILIITLSFQSWTKADDIRDFEIEGISVGDSLLTHYNKEQIKSAYENASYYKDNIFAVIFVEKDSINYDRIQVTLKPNDRNHKIFAIEGIIDFDKKIDKCNKKKNIIIQDLEQVLSNSNRIDDDGPYSPDLSGNSFSYMSWFFLDSGGYFSVTCRKMGNEVRKKYGWTDELSISATTKEMENFLRGNPY